MYDTVQGHWHYPSVDVMDDLSRKPDGSAGDADYASIGPVYTEFRVPDPRIAATIHEALGSARSVLNIGAGTGSYEPTDRSVTAVEPSATMRARRPSDLSTAIEPSQRTCPFPTDTSTLRWEHSPFTNGVILLEAS